VNWGGAATRRLRGKAIVASCRGTDAGTVDVDHVGIICYPQL
jgi:hypothetical protein